MFFDGRFVTALAGVLGNLGARFCRVVVVLASYPLLPVTVLQLTRNFLVFCLVCLYSAGVFHQHDYIVYPQEMKLPATLFEQFKDGVVNFFRGKSSRSSGTSDVEINVPTSNSMVMQSFLFYLEVYKTILLCHDLEGIDFVECFNQITVILKQHRQAIIRTRRGVHREPIHGIEMVSVFTLHK